jgi:integrase
MASVLNIGDSWRAQVRRTGYKPVTSTFPNEHDARAWAAEIEARMESRRGAGRIAGVKVSTALDKYLESKPVGRSTANVIEHLRAGLGEIMTDKLTAADVMEYVESREYGPSTAQHEVTILNTVLKTARLVFGYEVPNIMDDAREVLKLTGKLGPSRERERRPTDDELARLCEHFGSHSTMPMEDIIWFAVHTSMRAGEITRLRWEDYAASDKTIVIRNRKSPINKGGNDQTVPLLEEAVAIIERQPKTSEFIFPYNSKTFSSIFPRAVHALGIEDLRFHDLRHEGASRLFERGYQVQEVAMFTGHKDWTMLQRYTHLKAAELRRLPATAASSIPMSDSCAQA